MSSFAPVKRSPACLIEILCSPNLRRNVEGALPTNLPSIEIFAPSGADLIVTLEYSESITLGACSVLASGKVGRLAEYQVFSHESAIDFSVTAVAVDKSQRIEKPYPVVERYHDLSGLLKLPEKF